MSTRNVARSTLEYQLNASSPKCSNFYFFAKLLVCKNFFFVELYSETSVCVKREFCVCSPTARLAHA